MAIYVIVGNGVAGNAAAETIRRQDPAGVIHLFSREPHPFYYTPALPEFLAGTKEVNRLIIHPLDWYRERNISFHPGVEITGGDAQARYVTDRQGQRYAYDRLLLATGSVSFVPPIPGADLPGVCTLRTLEDARRIKEMAAHSRQAVLIGGGLLGLEAGNGLRQAGLAVTVVEFFPRLLPRQLDEAAAAILQRRLEAMGFRFHLGATTQEILRADGGLMVVLKDGERLPADMVLISAGVRPEVSLARALGARVDKGVVVDDYLRTSLPEVYAAGDVAEHQGRLYGIWPAAQEQGRIAGVNMAGGQEAYTGTVPANTLKVVGIDLLSAGEIDAEGKQEAVVSGDPTKGTYRKLVLKDNRLVGVILLGDLTGSAEIQAAIRAGRDVSDLKAELARPDFDFSRLK
jgi:nitrite reductase (NADH) large subunit